MNCEQLMHQTLIQVLDHGLRSGFVANMAQVGANRGHGDVKLVRNFLVGIALGQTGQALFLTFGQTHCRIETGTGRPEGLDHFSGHLAGHGGASLEDVVECGQLSLGNTRSEGGGMAETTGHLFLNATSGVSAFDISFDEFFALEGRPDATQGFTRNNSRPEIVGC